MNRRFICDKLVFEEVADEGYLQIAFSDNGDDPNEYLILQRGLEWDEQDVELGMDTYYLEYESGDAEIVGYGVCHAICLNRNEVVFTFADNEDNIDSLTIDISGQLDGKMSVAFREMFDRIIGKTV